MPIIWTMNILLIVEKLPLYTLGPKYTAFLAASTSAVQVHQASLCPTKTEQRVSCKQFNTTV